MKPFHPSEFLKTTKGGKITLTKAQKNILKAMKQSKSGLKPKKAKATGIYLKTAVVAMYESSLAR